MAKQVWFGVLLVENRQIYKKLSSFKLDLIPSTYIIGLDVRSYGPQIKQINFNRLN
jgi:hypothetical protein